MVHVTILLAAFQTMLSNQDRVFADEACNSLLWMKATTLWSIRHHQHFRWWYRCLWNTLWLAKAQQIQTDTGVMENGGQGEGGQLICIRHHQHFRWWYWCLRNTYYGPRRLRRFKLIQEVGRMVARGGQLIFIRHHQHFRWWYRCPWNTYYGPRRLSRFKRGDGRGRGKRMVLNCLECR